MPTDQQNKDKNPYALDRLAAGRERAQQLTDSYQEGGNHQDSNATRQEPYAPNIPKGRGGMQEGNGCRTSKSGGCGSEDRGCDKAQDMTNVIKGEWATEPPLDQPSRQNSLARIADALEYRSRKASITHQIGNDRRDHHSHDHRPAGAWARDDKNADRNA